jgi:hypothetical protein
LKAHHKIIGIPDDDDITACDLLAPGLNPQIEYVMQVHVGEQASSGETTPPTIWQNSVLS